MSVSPSQNQNLTTSMANPKSPTAPSPLVSGLAGQSAAPTSPLQQSAAHHKAVGNLVSGVTGSKSPNHPVNATSPLFSGLGIAGGAGAVTPANQPAAAAANQPIVSGATAPNTASNTVSASVTAPPPTSGSSSFPVSGQSATQPISPANSQPNPIPPQPKPALDALGRPLHYVSDKLNKLNQSEHDIPNQMIQHGAIRNDAGLHITDPQDQETRLLAKKASSKNDDLAHAYLYHLEQEATPFFGGKKSPALSLGKLGYTPTPNFYDHSRNASSGFGKATDKNVHISTPETAVAEEAEDLRSHVENKWGDIIDRGTNPFDDILMSKEIDHRRRELAGKLFRENPDHLALASQFVEKIKEQYPNIAKQHEPQLDQLFSLIRDNAKLYSPSHASAPHQNTNWHEDTATWTQIDDTLRNREAASRQLLKQAKSLIEDTPLKHSPYANQLYNIAWDNWRYAYNAKDKTENVSNWGKALDERVQKHYENMSEAEKDRFINPDEDLIQAMGRHANELPHVNPHTGGEESASENVHSYLDKAKNRDFQTPREAKESHQKAQAFMRQFRNYLEQHTNTPRNHPQFAAWESSQAQVKHTPTQYEQTHASTAQDWKNLLDNFRNHLANFEAYKAKLIAQKKAALQAAQYQNSPSEASYNQLKEDIATAHQNAQTYQQAIQAAQNDPNSYPANTDYRDYEPDNMDRLVAQLQNTIQPMQKKETWLNWAKQYKQNPQPLKKFLQDRCIPLSKETVIAFGKILEVA